MKVYRGSGKNLVSLIRLEDAFSDIDVYDDTEEGEIPYRQYLMRRWLFIHQDKYKNETLNLLKFMRED